MFKSEFLQYSGKGARDITKEFNERQAITLEISRLRRFLVSNCSIYIQNLAKGIRGH